MADLHLDLNQSLDLRITEFKNDSDKMRDVNEFLNELLEKAQKEAERRNGKQKGKLMVRKKLELGLIGPVHQLEHSLQGYSPLYATAQIQFGPLLLPGIITNNMRVLKFTYMFTFISMVLRRFLPSKTSCCFRGSTIRKAMQGTKEVIRYTHQRMRNYLKAQLKAFN